MSTRASGKADRVFGLDVMRAVAGIMVVLSHSSYLVAGHWPRFPLVPSIDWVGVFFVLSGYLIGGLLLDALHAPGPGALRFTDFMQRRWLRTLPNYYLFLGINIALVRGGLAPGLIGHATPAYFVFMQNFHVPLDLFFWESWSLAVEEWFYLLFPLLAFALASWPGMGTRPVFVTVCVLFLAFPLLARFHLAPHAVDTASPGLWMDKLVVTRLDAPGMGMLAAWLARCRPSVWRRMRWPGFILGMSVLVFMGAIRRGGHLPMPWLNGLEAWAVALLLPACATWRGQGRIPRTFALLSLITYALYLVHLPLLYVFGPFVPDPVAWKCMLQYGLFLAATLVLSVLIQRYWERPFMRLRGPVGRWLAARWPRSVPGN